MIQQCCRAISKTRASAALVGGDGTGGGLLAHFFPSPGFILIEFLWGDRIDPVLAKEGNEEIMNNTDIGAIDHFAPAMAKFFFHRLNGSFSDRGKLAGALGEFVLGFDPGFVVKDCGSIYCLVNIPCFGRYPMPSPVIQAQTGLPDTAPFSFINDNNIF